MPDNLIENVSDTAFWVAHYRALESRRPDALFHDPLAALLAGERGEKIAKTMPGAFMTQWIVSLRTCIIDEFITRAVADGVDLVLNLGAGLDTRPYRMNLPATLHWVEVDYPQMIEFKQAQLADQTPRFELERVKLDLTDRFARARFFQEIDARATTKASIVVGPAPASATVRPATKILILTEGVVPYLSLEDAASLADDLKLLNNARFWIVDYLSPQAIKFGRRGKMAAKIRNAPFRFAPADWFSFFRDHGWNPKEVRYFADEAVRLKRPLKFPPLLRAFVKLRGLFASRERRAAFRKMAGYALLEPARP